MSNPNGVPFTIAPVRSEDPKRKEDKDDEEPDKKKDKDVANGINGDLVDEKPLKENGKDEELVGPSCPLSRCKVDTSIARPSVRGGYPAQVGA